MRTAFNVRAVFLCHPPRLHPGWEGGNSPEDWGGYGEPSGGADGTSATCSRSGEGKYTRHRLISSYQDRASRGLFYCA